jgi:hypothetical protein
MIAMIVVTAAAAVTAIDSVIVAIAQNVVSARSNSARMMSCSQ